MLKNKRFFSKKNIFSYSRWLTFDNILHLNKKTKGVKNFRKRKKYILNLCTYLENVLNYFFNLKLKKNI